ncbi:unnamed protein product [Anisakis simplex]|uniref:Potassium channel domain-containing protein n=1 Tax=Anisakis simplex TaxID=6269 RepID=A0A3P6QTR2_ANISI|nr:unnamed protein product [Anisakis simplex]
MGIGCFARIGIHNESARFMLLAFILILYLGFGAILFNYLERENEIQEKREYSILLKNVRESLCNNSTEQCKQLELLLELNSNLTSAGLLYQSERFDISGSFFFAGTVISTIGKNASSNPSIFVWISHRLGFGMSTPRTTIGRLTTIVYGVLGCACCVLFFNLFLERFITILTYVLRYVHDRKVKRRHECDESLPIPLCAHEVGNLSTFSSLNGVEEGWKPSVYKVFVILFVICTILMFSAAYFYSSTEQWTYTDSLYFCFTGFATIGFGDFVPYQGSDFDYSHNLVRIANFLLLSLGACCMYCLFNVSSIVIRQLLNWLIRQINIKTGDTVFCCKTKPKRYMGLGLRPPAGYDGRERNAINENGEGLQSLKDFLMSNRNSVVLLQTQLIKSAAKNTPNEEKISANRVGPMGMLNETFGDV